MTTGTERTLPRATAAAETAAFFDSAHGALFGVLTRATAPAREVGILMLPGGGRPISTSRNRFSVRLTRELAAMGFAGVRFDYHGCGESTGTLDRFRLLDPFPSDLDAAITWAGEQGVERLVLMGSCFGARAALWVGADDPRVAGLVLVAMPVRDSERGHRIASRVARDNTVLDYLRKGLRAENVRGVFDRDRRRVYGKLIRAKRNVMRDRRRGGDEYRNRYELSDAVMRQLGAVVDRRLPILFVFGRDDDLHAEFESARAGPLGALLRRAGSLVEIAELPGHVHGYVSLEVQERVAEVTRDWLARRWTSA